MSDHKDDSYWVSKARRTAENAELKKRVAELEARDVVTPEYLQSWIDRAQDAEAKLDAVQWQPIETAPKDGRTILICSNGNVEAVRWGDDPRFPWEFIDCDGDRNAYMEEGVTHWMPLPEPPEGEDK